MSGANVPAVLRVIAGLIIATVLCASPLAAAGSSTVRLRSCGHFSPGAPNHVDATTNVTCAQARRLMRELLAGSSACYRAGFTSRPRCVLEGFHCSAHPADFRRAIGNCVHGRKRVRGDIVD